MGPKTGMNKGGGVGRLNKQSILHSVNDNVIHVALFSCWLVNNIFHVLNT